MVDKSIEVGKAATGTLADGAGQPVASAWKHLLTHSWTWRLASFALVFGAWQYAAAIPVSLAFPSFTETVVALGEMFADGSLFAIFAGLRLGTAQGFTGAILAELLITPTGVGDLITYHRAVADYPKMFAAILSIIIFAGVAINLLQKLEQRFFRPELHAG